MASQAEDIRKYAIENYVRPFLESNEATLSIRAGDVARSMILTNRLRAVCSALGGSKLQREAGLRLMERTGSRESTTTTFRYKRAALPAAPTETRAARHAPVRPPTRAAAGARPDAPPARGALLPPAADLCLVSCVKSKLSRPAPAKELYTSDLFRKERAVVEAESWPWFILSAQHGLVHPGTEIAPYEKTLNDMRAAERREWADRVMAALAPHLSGVTDVVFFASMRYQEFLDPQLRGRGVRVHAPMASMRIGERLAWLNAALHQA